MRRRGYIIKDTQGLEELDGCNAVRSVGLRDLVLPKFWGENSRAEKSENGLVVFA